MSVALASNPRERKRNFVSERKRENVSERERERVKESERVCEREIKRGRECLCVCMRDRDRESVSPHPETLTRLRSYPRLTRETSTTNIRSHARPFGGGISKSILLRPCHFLAINAHKMAPRTT